MRKWQEMRILAEKEGSGRGLMKREVRDGNVQMRKWREMRILAEKEGSGRYVWGR